MTYLAFVGLVYAAIRGLYQGIIMHQPNCREHPLFTLYHRTMFADALFAGWFAILLDRSVDAGGWFPGWLLMVGLVGLFFAGWELFELVYSLTRHNILLPDEENVFGSGTYARGRWLDALHLFRIVAGTVLLLKGGAL